MPKPSHLALALALFALAMPASAQMFSTLTQDLMQTRSLLKPVEDLAGRTQARQGAAAPPATASGKPATRAQASPPGGAVATTYAASPEVARRARGQFVDWLKSTSPDLSAAAEAQLRQADMVAEWSKAVREDGLKTGDAADALGAYWLLNWMMANSRTSNSGAEARTVRDQTRRYLQGNPGFAALGDAHRQEMAEIWMMNFLLQGNAYFDALKRDDRALAAKLGKAAVARFRNEMGIDLTRLQLTPAGFVAN